VIILLSLVIILLPAEIYPVIIKVRFVVVVVVKLRFPVLLFYWDIVR